MILAHKTVCLCTETDNDIAQCTVIHIQAALPDDLTGVNVQLISLMDMVVKQCCQQIVCRGDRMKITGKMQVQILHRNDLGVSAACCAALDSKTRS